MHCSEILGQGSRVNAKQKQKNMNDTDTKLLISRIRS